MSDNVIPPGLLFSFRIALAIQDLLHMHINFKIDFSISLKMTLKFLWIFHQLFRLFLVNINYYFNNINSAKPRTWQDFLSSSVFFNFFLQGFTVFIVEVFQFLC
jgi:hypothetical protein